MVLRDSTRIARSFTASKAAETFTHFAAHHQLESCELFKSWVSEFIAIYETFKNKVAHPRFAICDYLDVGVVDEFPHLQRIL